MCPSVLPHPLAFLCEWYSPFKKALVISQCSVSFQQSAAGSTFHRGSAGALMHTQTHSCCYRTLRDTHTGMLAHWHTLTTHTQPLKRTLLPANTHFPWAGRLSLRERTNCSEDLTWLSHKTKREKEQSEQGKKKRRNLFGGTFLPRKWSTCQYDTLSGFPSLPQAKILKMMDDNKQLAQRIDGAIQSASQEVTNLRSELSATSRRLAELGATDSSASVLETLQHNHNGKRATLGVKWRCLLVLFAEKLWTCGEGWVRSHSAVCECSLAVCVLSVRLIMEDIQEWKKPPLIPLLMGISAFQSQRESGWIEQKRGLCWLVSTFSSPLKSPLMLNN